MHILLVIIAWIFLVGEVFTIVCMPALFGTARKPATYTFAYWVQSVIGGVMVMLLALKVLGFI